MKYFVWGAVAALAICLSACGQFDKEAQYRIAGQELAADMAAVNSGGPDATPHIDPTTKATGEAGEFARTFKASLIKMLDERHAYRTQVTALHLEDSIKPEALSADGGIAHARQVLGQARTLTTNYKAQVDQRLAQIRRDMTAVAPGSPAVTAFQKSFDDAMARNPLGRVMADETKIFDEFGQVLDGLEQARGHWRASGSNFAFDRDSDLESFNDHMRAIQEASMDERTAVMEAQTSATAQTTRLNDAVK